MTVGSFCLNAAKVSIFLIPVRNPICSDLLFMNASLVTPRQKHVTFIPLEESELPRENDLVGLDAEFVTLNQVCLKELCMTASGCLVCLPLSV